ncbi:MAG: hypothetical protein M1457_10145, partial [bacterium]|nr:hypothetical protein [bacterium]
MVRWAAHEAEYLGLRAAAAVLGRIPPAWHEGVARRGASFLSAVSSFRRRVLDDNLAVAFGDLDGSGRRRLVREIYRNGLLFALEMARLRRATPAQIAAAVEITPGDRARIESLRTGERGFIFASAHMGNWEWMAAWYAQAYGKIGLIYKPMHNPRTERFLL